ncbi:MAG TPA: hypothetical protein VGZ02_13225 [Candidatus Baltobacteraceae bacterium]|jgi:uncharacterized protein (TIGR03492 family)|nr:hypothetical protein [Candidatus Baltobacteraceae bacterium]
MKRVLFVTNGHGEVAIAAALAQRLVETAAVACDHLALVGNFEHPSVMRDVGPRRRMPSGGLLAMGNVRNIVRDVRAGLLLHTLGQVRFLRGARGTYAAAVAVGDVFALIMALLAGTRTAFVGTAKSVYVAPYGPIEERIIRRAQPVYVRDEPTAQRLREHGIDARAGNVIVDLYAPQQAAWPEGSPRLALFPGSREDAYDDAAFLCAVVRALLERRPNLSAQISIAPGLHEDRFIPGLRLQGWRVDETGDPREPFRLFNGDREVVRALRGAAGAVLAGADAVMGQAGTANEAAAAAGIPVVAFAQRDRSRHSWYRRRQAGLLGDALLVIEGDAQSAARQVDDLLSDESRRRNMGEIGRQRMGAPGAASRIAQDIAGLIA